MTDTDIRVRLESIGLTEEQIEDVIPYLAAPATSVVEDSLPALREQIYQQMDQETDWRRRASLAARLISISLD